MAIIFGSYGTISKEIAQKMKSGACKNIFYTAAHVIEDEDFFCIGLLDKKNNQIIPIGNKSGLLYGKIFSKTDYLPVTSFDAPINAQELIAQYWGRFAGALWDHQTQTLSLIRDPIGLSSLFYYELPNGGIIFSSDMAMLYDMLEEKPEIAWSYFAEFLMETNQALPITPFVGVKELLPGMCYTMTAHTKNQALLWNPAPQSEQFIHTSDADIEEGLFHELTSCSRAWLSGVKGVTVELSGGIDSSGILLLYKEITQGKIPITAVHHTDSSGKNAQETTYAKEIAAECDVPLNFIDYSNSKIIGRYSKNRCARSRVTIKKSRLL